MSEDEWPSHASAFLWATWWWSYDRAARLWDATAGESLSELKGHTGDVSYYKSFQELRPGVAAKGSHRWMNGADRVGPRPGGTLEHPRQGDFRRRRNARRLIPSLAHAG